MSQRITLTAIRGGQMAAASATDSTPSPGLQQATQFAGLLDQSRT
jgi:hypothetical protein